MKEVIQTTVVTCDACGNEITNPVLLGENAEAVIRHITFERWYAGNFHIIDVCYDCNKKILNFLVDNHLVEHPQTKLTSPVS